MNLNSRFVSVFTCLLMISLFTTGFSVDKVGMNPIADPSIEGRWNLTIDEDGKMVPSWLEVQL